METENIIEMLHITKEFPGIIANDDITLQLRRREEPKRDQVAQPTQESADPQDAAPQDGEGDGAALRMSPPASAQPTPVPEQAEETGKSGQTAIIQNCWHQIDKRLQAVGTHSGRDMTRIAGNQRDF